MAGQKITLRKGTILQDDLDRMARIADNLRFDGRAIKVAAEMAKPLPDFNRTGPMQRLAMAAAKKDTIIPLLEGGIWPYHLRYMSIETLLIGYVMKTSGYSAAGLKSYAEGRLRSLEKDIKEGMPNTDIELLPLRALLSEGLLDSMEKANRAAKDAKSRVETLMVETILSQCPDLIIVREYLADTRIGGYANLEL